MNTEYKCVTDLAGIREYIGESRLVAFDFETSPDEAYRTEEKAALDPARSHIVGCSFSVKEGTGIYVPIAHLVGTNMDRETFFPFLKEFLTDKSVIKVAHNIAFESAFAYAKGIVIQAPVYDTICASQMSLKNHYEFRKLNESGLKKLAEELFGEPLPSFSIVTDGKHFDELDANDAETVRYGSADSDFALRLYYRFNEWFDCYLPKHRTIVEEIESPTAVYCGLMKYNGVPVDKAFMLKCKEEAERKIAEIRREIHFIIGDVDIGGNCSTKAFQRYLYGDLGLPVVKATGTNRASMDDAAMMLLKEWCDKHRPELTGLFTLVQEYRKWGKIQSTYINGYLKYIHPVTGRIHPSLLQLGTDTGRFSCVAPNMQNQIAPGSDPIGVRSFVAARPGKVLIEADYSQVELRIAAYLSRDKTMLEAYANGEDIHAITTSGVFGIPIEEAKDKHHPDYKHRRTVAKSTMFGILYGIGAKGLCRNLRFHAGVKTTESDCGRYIEGIKNHYTGLRSWQEEAKRCVAIRTYSETEIGRRRYLPGILSKDFGMRTSAERMAMNSPVQGLAADCLKYGMAQLVETLRDKPHLRPILTVHDSLVFEVDEDKAAEAAALVKRCMEKRLIPDMPQLVAAVSAGRNYEAMEEGAV